MTQVMDSILGMALQMPALKSIGESIGVDLASYRQGQMRRRLDALAWLAWWRTARHRAVRLSCPARFGGRV